MDITKLFCEKIPFRLAKQGEYGQEYSFDYSTWLTEFDSGTITWVFQGPSDSVAHALDSTEDDGISTIVLTLEETASAGIGSMEVFFVDDGETQKRISATIQFYIEPSLVIPEPEPGPGSGFSTASVTITNNSSNIVGISIPHVAEINNDAEAVIVVSRGGQEIVTVILYNGKAYATDREAGLNSSVSGDISQELGAYVITGDGSITYTDWD